MTGAEPPPTRARWVGGVTLAATVVGVALLLAPPKYSSDVNRVEVWCGAPLFFDEDSVSIELRQRGEAGETARLIGAECHERVTRRVAGSVLAGLAGVGALGIAAMSRRRP